MAFVSSKLGMAAVAFVLAGGLLGLILSTMRSDKTATMMVGAQPLITVNYGSNPEGNGGGTPQYAAAWVKYADVTHHDGATTGRLAMRSMLTVFMVRNIIGKWICTRIKERWHMRTMLCHL